MPFRRQPSAVARIMIPTSIPNPTPGNPPIVLHGIVEGDYVDVDTDDTTGRQQRVMDEATTVANGADGPIVRVSLWKHRIATLRDVIVGWGGAEGAEEYSPYDVDDLPPEVSKYIYDQWSAHKSGRTEAEKNASAGSSSRGPRQARASRSNSDTSTEPESPAISD